MKLARTLLVSFFILFPAMQPALAQYSSVMHTNKNGKKDYLEYMLYHDTHMIGYSFPAESESLVKEKAKNALQKAKQGDAREQFRVAELYYFGRGFKQSENEAAKWARKAAEQGHVSAQIFLGACYEEGKGVSKNLNEAIAWFTKAAEKGNLSSQYRLAQVYENGVEKDIKEAIKWYKKVIEDKRGKYYEEARKALKRLEGTSKNWFSAAFRVWTKSNW